MLLNKFRSQGYQQQLESYNLSRVSEESYGYEKHYISCPSHPSQYLTNICLSKECVEPLCPDCIMHHLDEHARKNLSRAKIENLQKVRSDSAATLTTQLDQLQKDQLELKLYGLGSQEHYEKCIQELIKHQERLQDLIHDFFNRQELELKQQMKVSAQYAKLYDDLNSQMLDDVRNHEFKLQQLHSQNFIGVLIKILEEDSLQQAKQKLQTLERAIKEYEDHLPKIFVDQNLLEHINSELNKLIVIATAGYKKPRTQVWNETFSFATPDTQGLVDPLHGTVVQSRPKNTKPQSPKLKPQIRFYGSEFNTLPVQNHLSHIPAENAQSAGQTDDLILNCPDHFQNKITDDERGLIVFQEDSKKMHLYYIYDSERRIQQFDLQIDYRIPINHKSFTTSGGQTFLVGGVYRELNRFKSSDLCYRLELGEMLLKPTHKLNYGRSLHTLCQVGEYLYAMGGSLTKDENGSINKCERMDLASYRWTPISDSKYKSSGSVAVPIKDQYIVKIGGKVDIFTPCTAIEIYEVQRDTWSELKYLFSGAGYLRLPFNASAVDIGANRILIFGGSVHDVRSNESSVLINYSQILNLGEVIFSIASITITRSIPRPIEFTTTQAITDNNQIWTFANVLGNFRILHGTEEGWREY